MKTILCGRTALMACVAGVFGALAISVGLSGPAKAASVILFDNSAAAIASGTASTSPSEFASFSTGASAINLTEVVLYLGDVDPNDGGFFTVSFLSDNSTKPGTVFDSSTFSDMQFFQSANSIVPVLLLTTGDILAANSRYWIEVSSTVPVLWSYSLDVAELGVSSEFTEFYL